MVLQIPSSGSKNSGNVSLVELIWHQKIKLAQNCKCYYVWYKARHEELSSRARKGEEVGEGEKRELWPMLKRLENMKAKIYDMKGAFSL